MLKLDLTVAWEENRLWWNCFSFPSICLFTLHQRRRKKTLPCLPVTWESLWPSMCAQVCFEGHMWASLNVLSSDSSLLTEHWRYRSQTWVSKTVKSSCPRASCAYLTSAACWSSTTWFAAWGKLRGDSVNRLAAAGATLTPSVGRKYYTSVRNKSIYITSTHV